MARLEPRIRALSAAIVDAVAPRGECDFVSDVSGELPSLLIAELMGITPDDGRRLYQLTERMHQSGAPADAQGRRGRGAQGPPVTLEMHLAEYKAVNGVRFPHLITRGVSGETNEEWVIKSYKVNPNLKANTFTK